jgi:hypothetical protein
LCGALGVSIRQCHGLQLGSDLWYGAWGLGMEVTLVVVATSARWGGCHYN